MAQRTLEDFELSDAPSHAITEAVRENDHSPRRCAAWREWLPATAVYFKRVLVTAGPCDNARGFCWFIPRDATPRRSLSRVVRNHETSLARVHMHPQTALLAEA